MSAISISIVAVIIDMTVFADKELNVKTLIIMAVSFVIGIMISRLLLLLALGRLTKIKSKNRSKWVRYTLLALFVPCKTDFYEYLCHSVNVKNERN